MGRAIQIMGGSFRRGLNSEVVNFSTRLAVQPSPLYKSNGKESKMAASYCCIMYLIGQKGFTLLLYMVQLLGMLIKRYYSIHQRFIESTNKSNCSCPLL